MTDASEQIRPLPARSAILSILLGAHPPIAPASEIVDWGRKVGISESTVRVALSRMVVRGDLVKRGRDYQLADRLLLRQRQQDVALDQVRKSWDGRWLVVVVVSVGLDAPTRLQLRRTMIGSHFAELREGVWIRPDNFAGDLPGEVLEHAEVMRAYPATGAGALAERLFHLRERKRVGRQLLARARKISDPGDRLTTFAAVVRHLVADPQLPDELLPPSWPVPDLRRVHARFSDELMHERSQLKSPN